MSEADAKAIRNERTKLTCTALNNVGVAIAVTGAVVPLVTLQIGVTAGQVALRITLMVWWLGAGVMFHLLALRLMSRIKA